jgi:hypothetical protein
MITINEKDKRALKFGGICALAIIMFWLTTKWLDHWGVIRQSLADAKKELAAISPSEAKQAGLLSIVPVFEIPKDEEKQKFLFRDKLDEQIKMARIKSKPLQILPAGKPVYKEYKMLRVKSDAKCRFTQMLDLLANLKENPYLVGIEEIKIKRDAKNKQEVEMDLAVSTFVK